MSQPQGADAGVDADVAHLIETAIQAHTDPATQVILYHTVITLLNRGAHGVVDAAARTAPDPAVRELLTATARTVSSHWTCEPDAGGARLLAGLFLIPVTVTVTPGAPHAAPLVLPNLAAVETMLREEQAIGNAGAIRLSENMLGIEQLGLLDLSQRFRLTRAVCEALPAERLANPFAAALLNLEAEQTLVAACYIMGIATGNAPARMCEFGKAPEAARQRFSRRMARYLADMLEKLGFTARVDVQPPALFPDALEAAYYRARLTGLELQVALELSRENAAVDDMVALVSVHDDGLIRISLNDREDDSLRLTYPWDIREGEDVARSLIDIRRALESRGVNDIRVLDGVQHTDGSAPAAEVWPRLGDLEHKGETLQ